MTQEKDSQDRAAVLRQWLLLTILGKRKEGATVKELASESGTNTKKVDRDLKVLQSAGFALKFKVGRHNRRTWTLEEGRIPQLNLTWDEAAALYISRKLLEPLAGTMIWQGAQRAEQKLQQCFDQNAQKYLSKLSQFFHPTRFGTSDYSNYSDILETLMIAIEDRKVLSLTYQSHEATEPATRDVYPYAMAYHKGTLYLIGWGVDRAAWRNYKVDRVSKAEIDPRSLPFNRVEFDVDKYLAGSFGIFHSEQEPMTVRIQFQPSVVRYVEEKTWHRTEQLQRQPDGTLIAEFQFSSLEEVRGWVLSFGANARVLEPPELKTAVYHDLRRTLQFYEPEEDLTKLPQDTEKMRRTIGKTRRLKDV